MVPLYRPRPLSAKTLTACHSYFLFSVNPALVTALLNSLGIIQSRSFNLLKEGSNIKIKTIVRRRIHKFKSDLYKTVFGWSRNAQWRNEKYVQNFNWNI